MTLRIRDEQSITLRRAHIAREMCEFLRGEDEEPSFEPQSGVIRSADKVGRTVRYQLGADGKLSSVTTPLGRVSRLSFSDSGILTELVEPSGRHTQVPCDEQGSPLRFVRNGAELARFTWNDERTECRHDFWDGSRSQASYSTSGQVQRFTNRLNNTESFKYDALGRLCELVDGLGQATRFDYDEQGHAASTIHADGRVESNVYDPSGVNTIVAVNGNKLFERTVDAASRPLSAKYADGTERTFAYNDVGKLLTATGPHGACTFEYREDGRLAREVSDGEAFSFDYDPTGLLTSMDYPDGTRAVFDYDSDKRLSRIAWGGATLEFAYGGQGLQQSITADAFVNEQYLDPSGKLARSVVANRTTRAPLFETSYSYDVQDRLISQNDSNYGEQRYVYDAQSQLLGIANAQGQWRETFSYDAAGNRIQTSGHQVEILAGNRLCAQGDWRCGYDDRGNIVTLATPGGTWHFTYDLQNQVTEADGPTGKLTFKYDALGRRIEKQTPDRTIRYVWCGEVLARELITTAQGESIRDYLYLPGTYVPLALRVDGQCYYYHNDHAGTPQRLTDGEGNVVWSAEYFAFGYAQVNVGKVENPLRFKGQYFDVETGLHYNRFRYYSPALGRYVSPDPVGLAGGHNLYVYANNDPLNRTDPTGLFSWRALGVGLIAAGAAICVAAVAAPALPFIAAAVGIASLGFVIGAGIAKYQAIGKFCSECFWRGAKAAAPWGFGIGLGLGLLGVICAPAAMVIGIGLAAYGTYALLDEHFGWSGGKPYDQMTDDEKSESLGGLVGGTVSGIVGGVLGGGLGLIGRSVFGKPAPRTTTTTEETGKTGEPNKPAETAKPAAHPPPDRALAEKCGDMQDPVFLRNAGEKVPVENARVAKPGEPMELDPNVTDRYLYVVNEDGSITYAPQSRVGSPEIIKHPNLTKGGPARLGGELVYDPATDSWVMDGSSGRLSTKVVGPPRTPGGQPELATNRTVDNVEAAAELARQSGTKQTIVTNPEVFPR